MADYFSTIAAQLGISIWLLVVIIAWSFVWKLLALWKSARKGSIVWFVILAIVNTVGILEILYLFIFSKMKVHSSKKKIPKKVSKRKKRR